MSSDNIYNNLIEQVNKIFRHNRQGSFKTKERYLESMKRFCKFLAEKYRLEKLANIAPKHIYAYVEHMQSIGLSASTIKTDLSAIRQYHDQMPNPKHKSLPDNRALILQRRSFGKVDRTWSNREFNYMLSKAWEAGRDDYAAVIYIARYVGLRIHECFRIDTATAEKALKENAITIKGKGGKIRTVLIHEGARMVLENALAATERGQKLFVPKNMATDIAIQQLQNFIIKYRDNGMRTKSTHPITFHGLRHTCAVEWYEALRERGMDEKEASRQVSRWLGHERPDVTRIYLAALKNSSNL